MRQKENSQVDSLEFDPQLQLIALKMVQKVIVKND
jgi:hypothetical protein